MTNIILGYGIRYTVLVSLVKLVLFRKGFGPLQLPKQSAKRARAGLGVRIQRHNAEFPTGLQPR